MLPRERLAWLEPLLPTAAAAHVLLVLLTADEVASWQWAVLGVTAALGLIGIAGLRGRWYVVAHVPAAVEKNACNAIESYRLREDGTIAEF